MARQRHGVPSRPPRTKKTPDKLGGAISTGRMDTIFALSSGSPPAAIALVRVSGVDAGAALEALAGRRPVPRRGGRIRGPRRRAAGPVRRGRRGRRQAARGAHRRQIQDQDPLRRGAVARQVGLPILDPGRFFQGFPDIIQYRFFHMLFNLLIGQAFPLCIKQFALD